MRVEWYYEDFSDPEAVSGSSTMIIAPRRGFFDARAGGFTDAGDVFNW